MIAKSAGMPSAGVKPRCWTSRLRRSTAARLLRTKHANVNSKRSESSFGSRKRSRAAKQLRAVSTMRIGSLTNHTSRQRPRHHSFQFHPRLVLVLARVHMPSTWLKLPGLEPRSRRCNNHLFCSNCTSSFCTNPLCSCPVCWRNRCNNNCRSCQRSPSAAFGRYHRFKCRRARQPCHHCHKGRNRWTASEEMRRCPSPVASNAPVPANRRVGGGPTVVLR
eukprot:symbB.v1.2.018013.t1/scaffold1375.1/size122712/5